MIGELKALLFGNTNEDNVAAGSHGDAALHHAAAGLLVEAAMLDGHFHDAERQRIESLLTDRFNVEPNKVSALIQAAEATAVERVELHTIADSLTNAADTTDVLKRHSSAPIASADDEKPLPRTVTGVPPSAAPRTGHTDDTAAAGRYVKLTPLDDVNCCPFSDTSTYRSPDDTDGGAEHST